MFGYSELELFSFWISFGSKGFLVLGQNVQLKKNNSIFFKASGDTKKKKNKKNKLNHLWYLWSTSNPFKEVVTLVELYTEKWNLVNNRQLLVTERENVRLV